MTRLQINLFGSFQLFFDDTPLRFAYAKQAALLAYLAMANCQPVMRGKLGLLLWPDKPPESVQVNLRKVLSSLRQLLKQPASVPPLLLFADDTVQINPESDVWLDVAAFQARLADCAAHRHRHAASCAPCHRARQQAGDLYRGAFLDGFVLEDSDTFEAWSTQWREALHIQALDTFQALAEYNWQRGRTQEAYQSVRRLLDLDPLHEEGNHLAIMCQAEEGQVGQALAHYEGFRRLLQHELGVAPSPTLQRVAQALRAGEGGHSRRPHVATGNRSLPPSTLQPLMGRTVEANELGAWLNDPDRRLITITGLGGVGKTHLALGVAQEQVHVFRDGVVFAALADVAVAEQVPAALAAVLACPLRAERPVLQQLAAHIASKDILLVLDHFEHLLVAKEDLAQLLQRCPGLVILVTSRQRLGLVGEWMFRLGGLNAPPSGMETAIEAYSAAGLFVHAARQARPDFELDADSLVAVAEICRLVGGLPLALVLVATWVRVLPCAELAAELRRGNDVIRSAGQDLGEERVSIRSVLEQSWQSLAPKARTALAALSVFHGGCDRQAAQVVAGADLDTLSHLADHSLVQVSAQGRITAHELVQQFAAEQLAAAGQGEQLTRQHFAYFLSSAERNAAQLTELSSLAAFLWFGQEQANLEAAATWGAGHPEVVSRDEVQRLRATVRRAGHRDGAHRGEFFQL